MLPILHAFCRLRRRARRTARLGRFAPSLPILLASCTGTTDPVEPTTEPFFVQLPSDAAGDQGLAVRVIPPIGDPRYGDEAPVVVIVSGGWEAVSLGEELDTPVHEHGAIAIELALPGGETGSGQISGGAYDLRGADSARALADALLYAAGELADDEGLRLVDRLPEASAEVGALGQSNGGNLILAALGLHGEALAATRWIALWESPVGDQFVTQELDDNPTYAPGTCLATTCPTPGQAELLRWDPDGETEATWGDSIWPGALALGDAEDEHKRFDPIATGYADDGALALYPSRELAADLRERADTLWGGSPPDGWVLDADALDAWWRYRDGSEHIPAISAAAPGLLVAHLQSEQDHAQARGDYPHAHAHLQGWLDAAHPWVRLNPDAAYTGFIWSDHPDADQLPDNPANVGVDWPDAAPQMVPDHLSRPLMLAGALELADRARFGDDALDLDAPLVEYERVE